MPKRKNIIWRLWKQCQSNETEKIAEKKILDSGIALSTFYSHCNFENIGKLSFNVMKVYSDVFDLSLNDFAKELEKYEQRKTP